MQIVAVLLLGLILSPFAIGAAFALGEFAWHLDPLPEAVFVRFVLGPLMAYGIGPFLVGVIVGRCARTNPAAHFVTVAILIAIAFIPSITVYGSRTIDAEVDIGMMPLALMLMIWLPCATPCGAIGAALGRNIRFRHATLS